MNFVYNELFALLYHPLTTIICNKRGGYYDS